VRAATKKPPGTAGGFLGNFGLPDTAIPFLRQRLWKSKVKKEGGNRVHLQILAQPVRTRTGRIPAPVSSHDPFTK
jgi:hypothetical protein